MDQQLPSDLSNCATPGILFLEILRTQAMLKIVIRKLGNPGDDILGDIHNAFMKRLMDYVEENRTLFPDPDGLIREILSKMTE